MNYWKWKIGILFLGFAVVVLFGVMYLWNWLMPEIFGLPQITFWQAAGLFLLSRALFGSWGGKKHGQHNPQRKWWVSKMKSKWQNMSPEQREKFKENWSWCSDDIDEKEAQEEAR